MTEAPIIILRGLEGNEPTHLSDLQIALLPHLGVLKIVWASVFVCVLVILVLRYIVIPLLKRSTSQPE